MNMPVNVMVIALHTAEDGGLLDFRASALDWWNDPDAPKFMPNMMHRLHDRDVSARWGLPPTVTGSGEFRATCHSQRWWFFVGSLSGNVGALL
jgi:hypothetical protein